MYSLVYSDNNCDAVLPSNQQQKHGEQATAELAFLVTDVRSSISVHVINDENWWQHIRAKVTLFATETE